ncbi:MAG: hypothetical protein H7A20_08365 [Rhodanobacteraceae bacterium]|nr:hypothetical protein [Xanthomonadales bacterium]MCP5478780.1 hypothetical protein [Rhodanobacteraceae bacterium]HPF73786.1 hypothetical protein [Xanthomonadaceae bacterium]HRY00196.1 hypothetical protein [Xanthomonadaceae bacterium]
MLEGNRSTGHADHRALRDWCIELQKDARLGHYIHDTSFERLRSSFFARYIELKALPRRQRRRLLRSWMPTIGATALLMALTAMPAQAATYNVIGFQDGPGVIIPDGVDVFATTTLRAAIEAANLSEGVPDTINLPTGVYTLLPGNGGSLDITDDLHINGAGMALTVIDAAAIGQRVFDIVSTDVVSLNGLTLAKGYVGDGTAQGAGIRNIGADLTLTDVGVLNSRAEASANDAYGAGIYSSGGSLLITDSLIQGNTAQADSNSVSDGSVASGGGIFFKADSIDDSLTIVRSTISGNTAQGGSGSISSGTGGNGLGGAIGINGIVGTTTSISDSTITGNTALGGTAFVEGTGAGGGIFNRDTLKVVASTFDRNSASSYGGGIHNGGILTVTNSTLSGNSASAGGGIENQAGTLTVTWSTFSRNDASSSGGGISSVSGTVHLAGNLFDVGWQGDNCVNLGTLADNGYNLSNDFTCVDGGTGSATNASLNLGPLVDGTHWPMSPSDAIGLIPNGTTVDNNGVTLACDGTATDQIGHARPSLDGDPCNAGAVETAPIPILIFEDGFE